MTKPHNCKCGKIFATRQAFFQHKKKYACNDEDPLFLFYKYLEEINKIDNEMHILLEEEITDKFHKLEYEYEKIKKENDELILKFEDKIKSLEKDTVIKLQDTEIKLKDELKTAIDLEKEKRFELLEKDHEIHTKSNTDMLKLLNDICKTPNKLTPFTNEEYITLFPNEKKFILNFLSLYAMKEHINFLADIIVNKYKTIDPEAQLIWNTDTSRYSYYIKQEDWTRDPKGKKLIKIVMKPMMNYLYNIFEKFNVTIQKSYKETDGMSAFEQQKYTSEIMLALYNGDIYNALVIKLSSEFYITADELKKTIKDSQKIKKESLKLMDKAEESLKLMDKTSSLVKSIKEDDMNDNNVEEEEEEEEQEEFIIYEEPVYYNFPPKPREKPKIKRRITPLETPK